MLKKIIVTGLICCAATSCFAYDMFDIFGRSSGNSNRHHHGHGHSRPVISAPVVQSAPVTQSAPVVQSAPVWQTSNGYARDNSSIALLELVASDLDLCLCSLRNGAWANNVMSVGYVNNALSALRRSRIHRSYRPLVAELENRLQRVRFYLVMNDVNDARARLNQISGMIRRVIVSVRHSSGGSVYSQPSYGYPNNSGYPVNTSYPGSSNGGYNGGYTSTWGSGQNVIPVGLPSTTGYRPNN